MLKNMRNAKEKRTLIKVRDLEIETLGKMVGDLERKKLKLVESTIFERITLLKQIERKELKIKNLNERIALLG